MRSLISSNGIHEKTVVESSERRLFNFALWKTAAEFCLSVGLVSMRTFWCTSARMTSENITFSIIALTVGVCESDLGVVSNGVVTADVRKISGFQPLSARTVVDALSAFFLRKAKLLPRSSLLKMP
jgi:hypothetical protein